MIHVCAFDAAVLCLCVCVGRGPRRGRRHHACVGSIACISVTLASRDAPSPAALLYAWSGGTVGSRSQP